jgi:CRISPR-associated endonuclease Csn1
VYEDSEVKGKRSYASIPLNEVIERQKQGLHPIPEKEKTRILFHLSPNDLVYVPGKEEIDSPNTIDFKRLAKDQVSKIYKVVSFSGNQCFLIRNDIATSIVNKFEFSPLNKTEKSIDGIMIKEFCIKINIDRLGNIKLAL